VPLLELNCCFGSRDDRYTSSIDPNAVRNKFGFLHLTPLRAPIAIATAPMHVVYVTQSDSHFLSAMKVKVNLGLAQVKPLGLKLSLPC